MNYHMQMEMFIQMGKKMLVIKQLLIVILMNQFTQVLLQRFLLFCDLELMIMHLVVVEMELLQMKPVILLL